MEKPIPQKESEGSPTIQNSAYRVITKDLRNRSPKENIKSNKGLNITMIPLQLSKYRIILLTPKIP